ncbi:MAG: chorismate mutase [Rhodospirillales bacterium]|nr:chorismate mutase [Rhodospirillales bacterium]
MGVPEYPRPQDGIAMTSRRISLDSLRAEIDKIDDTMHDLIMRRTGIVEHVRDLKKKSPVKIRPAREAEILYRLMARHRGPFPKREIARIWRELIVATLTFEGPFSLAVLGAGDESGYVELARDQYGAFTPVIRHRSAKRVVDAVRAQKATLGILPLPRTRDPWLRHLMGDAAPKVIARLPFIGHGSSSRKALQALVICPVAQEPTGRDVSYLAIEAAEKIAPTRLRKAFQAACLPVRSLAAWKDKSPRGWLYLTEVGDFVGSDDGRRDLVLRALAPAATRIIGLGGYAEPLTRKELRS